MIAKLPPDLVGYVSELVTSGRYASEDDVYCAALRALQREHRPLKKLIEEGLQDPENDTVLEDDEALTAFFDELLPFFQPQSPVKS